MYSVGQVSGSAGVTVRTLHHYDRAGLLSPGARSAAGCRLYTDADLARLQQILFYRELGFPLDEIAERAMEVRGTGVELTSEERFEVFGEVTFDLSYATGAQLKWEHSEGHQRSMTSAARHTRRTGR